MKQNVKADVAPAQAGNISLRDALLEIGRMAQSRKSCIRMPNGMMLDNYIGQVLATKPEHAPAQCGQHTLGKWKVLERYTDRQAVPIGVEIASSGGLAHSVFAEAHGSNCDANAAFIVTACNAHDQLVGALQVALERLEASQPPHLGKTEAACEQARAALALAEGGQQ